MTGTLGTPQAGSPNSSEDPKVATAIATLNGLLTGGNLIDPSQFPAASVADAKLASPNNSVYKTLLGGGAFMGSGLAAGTYGLWGPRPAFTSGSYAGAAQPAVSGGALFQAGTSGVFSAGSSAFIYFDDADYIVGSLTQKLQLRAQVSTNATQPTITFTFGMYPVTFAGPANELDATLGTVVSGSTVAIASPPASTVTTGKTAADFTIPSDGFYCVGVVTSGALTNNNASLLTAQLQTRNV